jgi:hypothetical protein
VNSGGGHFSVSRGENTSHVGGVGAQPVEAAVDVLEVLDVRVSRRVREHLAWTGSVPLSTQSVSTVGLGACRVRVGGGRQPVGPWLSEDPWSSASSTRCTCPTS